MWSKPTLYLPSIVYEHTGNSDRKGPPRSAFSTGFHVFLFRERGCRKSAATLSTISSTESARPASSHRYASMCISAERQILFQRVLMLFMVPFRKLRYEIEKRDLPSGGWISRDDHRIGIETTCLTERESDHRFRITSRREAGGSSFYLVVFALPK
jgi:hypothetical protein